MNLLFAVERRRVQQGCYQWYQLQLPSPRACQMHLTPIAALPGDWRWGADFLPTPPKWLSELMWLRPDEGFPRGHCQVSFVELALDYEPYAGRPLPPTPHTRFKGSETSL